MTEILFQWEGFDEVIAGFEGFVPALERDLKRGAQEAGRYLVNQAQAITVSKGALGASQEFFKGWTYQPDSGALSVTGRVVNTAGYAAVVEYGRGAGKPMPPHNSAFEEWLNFKGLPLSASYVIRRSIGRDGIPGLQILDALMEQHRDAAFTILERYLGEAIDRVWRAAA